MNTHDQIRVRFAPSPTGYLHIGGLRTAIFNWLFARHNNGTFVVRVEDTDRERSRKEYTDAIMESMAWMGIESDEPIAIQSEFVDKHQELLKQLVAEGKAYKCYCSQQALDERLGIESPDKKYDRVCRLLEAGTADAPYVIRFKLPTDRDAVTFNDLIRGQVTIGMDQLDDFIIARSDGSPIYNFVVVVDDAMMKINHIIRGEEHLGNTPKQILLYEALGYSLPIFAHIPLILSPTGGKLSKRDGAVSAIDYKHEGFLPDGMLNYLVRLGWSHGDQEIFSRQELIEYFTLDSVGKSGAIFDHEKLGWVNGMHLKGLPAEAIDKYIESTFEPSQYTCRNNWNREQWFALIDIYKVRVDTVIHLINEIAALNDHPTTYKSDDIAEWLTEDTRKHLVFVLQELQALDAWSAPDILSLVKNYCKQNGLKLPQIAQPIRLALLGHTQSPSIFALMVFIGKDESLARINRMLNR